MTDHSTRHRLIVAHDGAAAPYIMVPVAQLAAVESVLNRNQFSFWVDADSVAVNGGPPITVINLARGASAADIQLLLDAVD